MSLYFAVSLGFAGMGLMLHCALCQVWSPEGRQSCQPSRTYPRHSTSRRRSRHAQMSRRHQAGQFQPPTVDMHSAPAPLAKRGELLTSTPGIVSLEPVCLMPTLCGAGCSLPAECLFTVIVGADSARGWPILRLFGRGGGQDHFPLAVAMTSPHAPMMVNTSGHSAAVIYSLSNWIEGRC